MTNTDTPAQRLLIALEKMGQTIASGPDVVDAYREIKQSADDLIAEKQALHDDLMRVVVELEESREVIEFYASERDDMGQYAQDYLAAKPTTNPGADAEPSTIVSDHVSDDIGRTGGLIPPTGASYPAASCKCTFAQKTVGDGCDMCNPELAAKYTASEQTKEKK